MSRHCLTAMRWRMNASESRMKICVWVLTLPEIKSGGLVTSAFQFAGFSASQSLELEAYADLYLPFTEERGIRLGDCSEGSVVN